MKAILGKSFLAAYLLTEDIRQAENAVREAISAWQLDRDDERQLFEITLKMAARAPDLSCRTNTGEEAAAEVVLPTELYKVLQLEPELRRPFVLRVLAGVPSAVCAQILSFQANEIDCYCCLALERLSAHNVPGCMSADKDRRSWHHEDMPTAK
jgi:hypothetical protein